MSNSSEQPDAESNLADPVTPDIHQPGSEIRSTKRIGWGTGLLITAAFIGPGTVVTASRAGAATGFQLLWAVLFSVVATCVLQSMAARLGLVTKGGISAAVKSVFKTIWLQRVLLGLVLVAILYGNTAYQTGNLLGAVQGLEILLGGVEDHVAPMLVLLIGFMALGFLFVGGLKRLQLGLGLLVAGMSVLFLVAVVGAKPDGVQVARGLVPEIPAGSLLLVIGLIGTTVVPYNLFLHSSAMAEQANQSRLGDWRRNVADQESDEATAALTVAVRHSTWDTILSVSIGGVITAGILVTAAVAFADESVDVSKLQVRDVAKQLVPVIDQWASKVFGVGLLAAGLTSAITAPIAAGYCAAGCFGWEMTLDNKKVKLVAGIVIAIGMNVGIICSGSPAQAILLAQVANGLLLPLLAGFLLYVMNQKSLMGRFANGWFMNVLGFAVLAVTTGLAATTFYKLAQVWL